MLYSFDIALTDKDYYEFNKFHVRHTPQGKNSSRLTYISLAVLFVIVSALVFIRHGFELYTWIFIAIWLLGITLIALLLDPLLTTVVLRISIAIMKRSGKLPYERMSTIEFYDEVFVEITETNRNEIKYSGVERVMISSDAVYLYMNGSMAYILPTRVFRSTEELSEFTKFISEKNQNIVRVN